MIDLVARRGDCTYLHAFDESINHVIFEMILFYVNVKRSEPRKKKHLNLRKGFLHDVLSVL